MLEADQLELNEVSNLLHVIFHRNKNQHRPTKWWKWFAMLRRSVNHLRTELDRQEFQRVDARVKYMRDTLLHRCHQ
jgi:ribonuclease MRP protein subunit RMP1